MKQANLHIRDALSGFFSEREIDQLIKRIIGHVCQLQTYQLLRCKDMQLSEKERQSVYEITVRLQKHEPIQYILGETEFYGLPINVSLHVLIPRPETEELVEWTLENEKLNVATGKSNIRISDIGTGSGCIAIALAKHLPNAIVFGIDISEEALKTAKINEVNNHVSVQWIQLDVLSNDAEKIPDALDMIISNPPYVLPSEKAYMQENVLRYEPHPALFVPEDSPLLFYEKIADAGIRKLKPGGRLYFEINASFGVAMQEMLRAKGYHNIQLKQDISGKDRMIKAER